jgi:hypothetical protein
MFFRYSRRHEYFATNITDKESSFLFFHNSILVGNKQNRLSSGVVFGVLIFQLVLTCLLPHDYIPSWTFNKDIYTPREWWLVRERFSELLHKAFFVFVTGTTSAGYGEAHTYIGMLLCVCVYVSFVLFFTLLHNPLSILLHS